MCQAKFLLIRSVNVRFFPTASPAAGPLSGYRAKTCIHGPISSLLMVNQELIA